MRITLLVAQAYGCQGPLDDGPAICAALREAAAVVGATVLREATHAYAPHGVTAMVFLAESHLLVTTWPEHRYAVVEVFLCNEAMDPGVAWGVLERVLCPERTELQGVPLAVG